MAARQVKCKRLGEVRRPKENSRHADEGRLYRCSRSCWRARDYRRYLPVDDAACVKNAIAWRKSALRQAFALAFVFVALTGVAPFEFFTAADRRDFKRAAALR